MLMSALEGVQHQRSHAWADSQASLGMQTNTCSCNHDQCCVSWVTVCSCWWSNVFACSSSRALLFCLLTLTVLAPDSSALRLLTTPQAWNFVSGSSGVFLFPYLNLYLAQRGLSSAQIGLLAALRTWLAAPISLAATATSDRYKVHKQLLLLACIASCGLRSSLPLVSGTGVLFATLLLADLLGAPVGVLADSTVLSNCNEVRGSCYAVYGG